MPAHLEERIRADADRYAALDADALDAALRRLLDEHVQTMDREAVSLYAGTNVMNPAAAALLGHSIGVRPSLGYPGAKYETGMAQAEQVEILATTVLSQLFGCRHVELRVPSGSLANLYAFMAAAQPGDVLMAFPERAAGHVTHHAAGAAGLYGLTVVDVPYDDVRMQVDLDGLAAAARSRQPRVIVVGGSMNLHPYDLPAIRAIADEIGATVVYDAAHMAGLIAGGAWQHPLRCGAHLMTCSTYKSFGGPPQGLVLTDDNALAQRLDAIAHPGLTANFDLSRTAALAVAALDLRVHGAAYAAACVANARALGEALQAAGVPVHTVPGRGMTSSHQLAVPAQRWGGGTAAARLLEPANILASGIGLPGQAAGEDGMNALRLATQEVTRWGLGPAEMAHVADLTAAVLFATADPADVRREVAALRAPFQTVRYVRSGPTASEP